MKYVPVVYRGYNVNGLCVRERRSDTRVECIGQIAEDMYKEYKDVVRVVVDIAFQHPR